MQPNRQDPRAFNVTGHVRGNAVWAAIGAACLVYFGFVPWHQFIPPKNVDDLFSLGDWIFNYTLRIGGIALAIVAVWCVVGHLKALLFDAIVSTAIGALLVACGLMMILGGGFGINQILYLIFGYFFASAGLRNWRDYRELSGTTGTLLPQGETSYDPGFEQRYEKARSDPDSTSLASQLLKRGESRADQGRPSDPGRAGLRSDERLTFEDEPPASADADLPTATGPQAQREPPKPSPKDVQLQPIGNDSTEPVPEPQADLEPDVSEDAPEQAPEKPTPGPEPPGGFLASFAKKDPPDKS